MQKDYCPKPKRINIDAASVYMFTDSSAVPRGRPTFQAGTTSEAVQKSHPTSQVGTTSENTALSLEQKRKHAESPRCELELELDSYYETIKIIYDRIESLKVMREYHRRMGSSLGVTRALDLEKSSLEDIHSRLMAGQWERLGRLP